MTEPGGPLVVSGGGTTAVATDELFALSSRVRELAARSGDWVDALAAVEWASADRALDELVASARHRSIRLELGAREVADGLDRAAESYGTVDRLNTRAQEQ